MRVYEIAKKFGVTNKDILDFLSQHDIVAKSHMSNLNEDAVRLIEASFSKKEITMHEIKKESASEIPAAISPVPKHDALNKTGLTHKKNEAFATQEVSFSTKQSPEFIVLQAVTLGDLADILHKPASEVILMLLRNNIVCAKNQLLSEQAIAMIAAHYNIPTRKPELKTATVGVATDSPHAYIKHIKDGIERAPVVVILGHVDHGKTTLLDFIRSAKVALKEKGGITQHLGAYKVHTKHGDVVFLDTPGHDAFSNIRERGVNVADIAVLVVAADDGIMPQTVDAINKAKAAHLPIVVAINKVDKADIARIESVKREFARYDILPEEWGGSVIFAPISAKTGAGIDNLLEMILLQAQMMELRYDDQKNGIGFILESKLQKGLGPVATVICQQGILKTGEYFQAGSVIGKIISMIDTFGKRMQKVGASLPVQVSGFSDLPVAGDYFQIIPESLYRQLKSSKEQSSSSAAQRNIASERAFKVIIKADNSSSKEALKDALQKVVKKMQRDLFVVSDHVGDIIESDIISAINTDALIVGLHVKVDPNAQRLAEKNKITILLSSIIYKLLEDIEVSLKANEPVKMVMKKVGEAVVRKVFNIKGIGTVAGSYVKDGRFAREGKIVAWRGKERIGEGYIKSLERDRKSVKEVHEGFEFAFLVDSITDWQIDDRAECYIEQPQVK